MKERRCRVTGYWRDQRGFTLVELILTIAILAIVTIPILSYFTDAAKHNARSRQKQNASVLAQDVLEEFKNTPYSLDDPDLVCSAQPDWTVAASPDANGTYTLTQDKDVDNSSFKVTAQIQPLSKVVPAATAIPKNYEKYVIGTMDSSKDVMSSEHGQTLTSASYAFANKHAAAYANAPGAATATPMPAEELKKNLDCSIIISAKEDSAKPGNDIISVKYKYTYNKGAGSYPAGIDASTVYEDVVESASINVKKLENIYLFYQPVNERDQIILETNDANAIQLDANDLNLFVIAQNSVKHGESVPAGYTERPQGYKLSINSLGSGFATKIQKLYLNLSANNTDELNANGDQVAGKAQKDPSGNYTLVHSESINRMADITVTVDSQDGSKTGIVQVNGSKVQN